MSTENLGDQRPIEDEINQLLLSEEQEEKEAEPNETKVERKTLKDA